MGEKTLFRILPIIAYFNNFVNTNLLLILANSMSEITLNAANFEAEVLKNPGLVLVDFWAEWCGPCKMMLPILAEVSQVLADKPIIIAKCNVDDNAELTEKYGIMSIPAFKIFKNGAIIDEWVGAQTKENLITKLEKYLT